jgi:hypothetical protein
MKKLMAITVMIALCASAAFADTTVSGAVETRLNVFTGQFGDFGGLYGHKYPKFKTSGEVGAAWFQMTATNSEGTMGGTFRLRGTDIESTQPRWHKVNVWWKPIPQLKVFLGQDADGMFERGQLTSWAFHQGSEQYLVIHNWDFWRCIFPGNFDTMGVALSFYLVDGLELNLVAPIGKPDGWPRHMNTDYKKSNEWDVIWPASLQLLGGYQIGDIGKVHFAWIGRGNWTELNEGAYRFYSEGHAWDSKTTKTYGTVHLSFYSGMIQGLQFQVGASMDIQNTGKADLDGDGVVGPDEYVVPKNTTNPMFAGAAVHFSAGDFGIKWRLGTKIETKTMAATGQFKDEKDGGFYLTTNIMPTYKLGALGNVCLDIGFSLIQPGKKVEVVNGTPTAKAPDAEYGFWINPYLKKSISGGYVQAGIIYQYNTNGSGVVQKSDKDNYDRPKIAFPVIMGMNF